MEKIKFSILTYPNKTQSQPDFYIQCKGLHSGRPLRQPIKNCVAVYSEHPRLFDLVYLLYKGKRFDFYIIGSVIPFIRIDDLTKVVKSGLENFGAEKLKYLEQNALIDQALQNCKNKEKLLQNCQIALCHEFLK